MKNKKRKRSIGRRLLPLTFIGTVVTGVGLHLARHGNDYELCHGMTAAHIIVSILFFISVLVHVKAHRKRKSTRQIEHLSVSE